MTATIGADGFCTRCQLVADWCKCPPVVEYADEYDPGDRGEANGDRDLDPGPPPGPEPARPFARYDLGSLLASGVPPPRLLCGGLLYAGGLHTLTGPPDAGKTTIALWCALRLLAQGCTVAMFD